MTCIANLFVCMFLIVRLYYKLVDNLSKCNYHLQCMHESYACRWFGKISRKNLFDGSNFEILYIKKWYLVILVLNLHINNHLQLSVYCVNIVLFQNISYNFSYVRKYKKYSKNYFSFFLRGFNLWIVWKSLNTYVIVALELIFH